MSRLGIVVGATALAVSAGSAVAQIDLDPGVDSTKSAQTTGLVGMDISSHVSGATASDLTMGGTVYEAPFADAFGGIIVGGGIRTEVYANQSIPGLGVNEVLLVITMSGSGATPIEAMEFGVNTGVEIDFGKISAAAHGRLTDATTAGQQIPDVKLFDNIGSNDTLVYDYTAGTAGADTLGTGESFTWYMRFNDPSISLEVVDVTITDGQVVSGKALLPVIGSGQDDLNVPTPGVLGAFAGAGLIGLRRRR